MAETVEKSSLTFKDGVLILTGELKAATVGNLERELGRQKVRDVTVVDGSRVTGMDTSGALFVTGFAQQGAELRSFGEQEKALFALVTGEKPEERLPAPRVRHDLEYLGGVILREIDRLNEIAILIVDILFWSIIGLFKRDQYRKGTFTEQAVNMGSSAFPIITLILFLIGAVTALQSAETLKNFGASIFVVDMLALGLARELAPLMTAIIISGRSGSAIASEIATMKFTEELDAIKTMGLNPLRFVVVPKLWAMIVCLPLLTVMALIFGLIGGFIIAVGYMELSPNTFFGRLLISLFFWDIVTGLIKSISFAIIITVVGTYRGLTFTGGADGVGRATTSSVVTSIFSIIVMDAIWSIVFYF